MTLDILRAANHIGASAYHFGLEIMRVQPDGNVAAGLLAAMCFQAVSQGHSCLDTTVWQAVFSPAVIQAIGDAPALDAVFAGNTLVSNKTANQKVDACLLHVDGNRLYLQKYWQMEQALINQIRSRISPVLVQRTEDTARDLAAICLQKPLILLTGGPGTGKTTTISRALVIWTQAFHQSKQHLPNIILCAPTGKAAARMTAAWLAQKPTLLNMLEPSLQAALPDSAQTLHRMMAINPTTRHSRFNADNPLKADLIVLDEASMVDMQMLLQLLSALDNGTHVLLVGDPNQLPSIEAGNVLGALLENSAADGLFSGLQSAHVLLSRNFRQQKNPGLTALTEDCLLENAETLTDRIADKHYENVDYRPLDTAALSAVINDATSYYRQLSSMDSVQSALAILDHRIILTPVRAGPVGSVTLNIEIARRLSAKPAYHGQVIMVIENNAGLKLSNGDIGILWQQGQELKAYFWLGSELSDIALNKLPNYELAYALTIHKAQGSEYQHVDLLLPKEDNALLSKALIYTAITRASNSLRLISDRTIFRQSVQRTLLRMHGFSKL